MNKLKKALYNITRPYARMCLTYDLGKVVEDDEKITCYIKKSKIIKKDRNCIISCFGIGENEKRKKFAKAFNLDKRICYVIDGIDLRKYQVYIFGHDNCEIIIRNCNLGLGSSIWVDGKCTLDNTNIITLSSLSISAKDLVIKNMNKDQIKSFVSSSSICFDADNRIDVIDSNIGNQNEDVTISLASTNELNIINSKIAGKIVNCKSSTINTDEKSSLTATDRINLQTDELSKIKMETPTVVLNGKEMINKNKKVVLEKVTEPLELKRIELINLLKKIKNKCEIINSKRVLQYQEELGIQPISKVLKNK